MTAATLNCTNSADQILSKARSLGRGDAVRSSSKVVAVAEAAAIEVVLRDDEVSVLWLGLQRGDDIGQVSVCSHMSVVRPEKLFTTENCKRHCRQYIRGALRTSSSRALLARR